MGGKQPEMSGYQCFFVWNLSWSEIARSVVFCFGLLQDRKPSGDELTPPALGGSTQPDHQVQYVGDRKSELVEHGQRVGDRISAYVLDMVDAG